jgi:putative tricarboxylic transport membrane protein
VNDPLAQSRTRNDDDVMLHGDWRSIGARGWPGCIAALMFAAAAAPAHAQQGTWRPERPVENVVASAAGGAGDANARLFQTIAQKYRLVDVPIIIASKPGGGQAVALNYMDQHAGDGHYVMNSTMGLMTAYIMGRSKVTYTDYTTLAILYGEYMTLAVKPDSPLKNGRDVMERLKRDPQSLSIAIGLAIGGTNHISVGLITKAMGVDVRKLKTVIFQTNAQGITAIMGGHVDVVSLSLAIALRAAKQGQVRIIGISSERRSEGAADIPTWREQGLDVVFSNIRFAIGPKALGAAQTAYWDGVFERLIQTEEWKNEVQLNDWALDYAGSRQAPPRMARLNSQLKVALTDAGLVKE